MDRRTFLKGLTVVTAAGLLIPERKVWSLDRTMVQPMGGIIAPAFSENTDQRFLETGWFDAGLATFDKSWWYEITAIGSYHDGSTWFEVRNGDRQYTGIDRGN